MWPILGPIEYSQAHRSANYSDFQRSLFGGQSPRNRTVQSPYEIYSKSNRSSPVIIKSNIRYTDPISSTYLILYNLILVLLCILPIFALNICLRQAFDIFHQSNLLQIDDYTR